MSTTFAPVEHTDDFGMLMLVGKDKKDPGRLEGRRRVVVVPEAFSSPQTRTFELTRRLRHVRAVGLLFAEVVGRRQ